MAESSLHKSLKEYYRCNDSGSIEQSVDGFIIDVLIDNCIIEIQTKGLAQQRRKLEHFLNDYRYKIVLPIPRDKYIITIDKEDSNKFSRRLSPKHGTPVDMFKEIVYLTKYISHPNMTIELLITKEEELRINDGKGSWRRKGVSIQDHKLLEIMDTMTFSKISDFCYFIPELFDDIFTTEDFQSYWKISSNLAQRMAYVLRKINLITMVGKKNRRYQ